MTPQRVVAVLGLAIVAGSFAYYRFTPANVATPPAPNQAVADSPKKVMADPPKLTEGLELATFAGGCFWCVETDLEKIPGVVEAVSGYAGGRTPNPTYDQVSHSNTGHLEVVQISFDPMKISYEELLDIFWRIIDPTDPDGQFVDKGPSYQTAIFYHNEAQKAAAEKSKAGLAASGRFKSAIVTPIRPATQFYPGERYHQNFCTQNPLRYNSYRYGSGRDRFLDSVWGKDRKVELKAKDAEQSLAPLKSEK